MERAFPLDRAARDCRVSVAVMRFATGSATVRNHRDRRTIHSIFCLWSSRSRPHGSNVCPDSSFAVGVPGLAVLLSGCGTTHPLPPYERPLARTEYQTVRTTAYTHTEADHLPYGNHNALGGTASCRQCPDINHRRVCPRSRCPIRRTSSMRKAVSIERRWRRLQSSPQAGRDSRRREMLTPPQLFTAAQRRTGRAGRRARCSASSLPDSFIA